MPPPMIWCHRTGGVEATALPSGRSLGWSRPTSRPQHPTTVFNPRLAVRHRGLYGAGNAVYTVLGFDLGWQRHRRDTGPPLRRFPHTGSPLPVARWRRRPRDW